MSSNKPVQTLRDGSLKASIWQNETREGGSFFSTQFGKTYEDPKTGELKDSNSFSGTDLLKLSELARKAYAYEGKLKAELNREETQGERPKNTRRTQRNYSR